MINRWLAIISFLFITIALSLIYVFIDNAGSSLIIRADVYRRLNFLGSRQEVVRLAIVGLGLVLFNTALSRLLIKKYPFISFILSWGTVIVAILILVVVSGIILTN